MHDQRFRAGHAPEPPDEDDTVQTKLTKVKARCRRVLENCMRAKSMRPPAPGGVDEVDVSRLKHIHEPQPHTQEAPDPIAHIIARIMGTPEP